MKACGTIKEAIPGILLRDGSLFSLGLEDDRVQEQIQHQSLRVGYVFALELFFLLFENFLRLLLQLSSLGINREVGME